MEKQMIAATPLGRMDQPGDVADVAVFLASDASRWITGERIRVAGGFADRPIASACGTGGTVKSGVLEYQGDHREQRVSLLAKEGIRSKLAGG